MTDTSELKLSLDRARDLLKDRSKKVSPGNKLIKHISEQIDLVYDYIRSPIDGNFDQLKKVNVGLVAIREIEDMDPEFAEALESLQHEVDNIL